MASLKPLPDARLLKRMFGANPTAAQIATLVAEICESIDRALAPIIGHGGVAALYRRSVHVSAAQQAWLGAAVESHASDMNLPALLGVLDRRSADEAADAGAAIFRNFHELLTVLVGASLTDRLLQSVWIPFSK